MPRDGSGNYTLPSGNPVVTGTLIESAWANPTMADFAVQFNNVLTRDGLLGPVNPFKLVDGAVATPGLGFNSEPGLGLYRVGTANMAFSAVNATTYSFNANTAADVNFAVFPRAAGASRLFLNRDVSGTANTSAFSITHSSTDTRLESLAVGSGSMGPMVYQATLHKFQLTNANVFGQLSRPSVDSVLLTMNKNVTAGSLAQILGTRNGLSRWSVELGNGTTETGSNNSGSGFAISRYNDAGTYMDSPLQIDRFPVSATMLAQVGLLNVVNPITPFTSGLSVSTGAPTVTTPKTTMNGNVEYFAGGFTGAVGTGSIKLSGGILDLLNTGTPCYLQMAPNAPIAWNAWFTSGAYRSMLLFDANGGTSGFGDSIRCQMYLNPGVNSILRFHVGTTGGSDFDMGNNGTGGSPGGWVSTSDRRVKEHLTVISDALLKVRELTGYTYDKMDMLGMDGSAPRKAGYIAQDVQKVLPEAVTTATDEMGTLSVDHNGLIGLLIEAVKELHDLVELQA